MYFIKDFIWSKCLKEIKKKSLRFFIIFLLYIKMNLNLKLRLLKGLLFWYIIFICFLYLIKFICKFILLVIVNGEFESESIFYIYY